MTQILYAYISEKNHNYLIKEHLRTFPVDFQKKILSFRNWQDAQLSLLGRLILRYGLQINDAFEEKDNIGYTSYNKPFLIDSDIKFNISHAGELVVCILSDLNEVGIDVEIMSDINIEDFESQMTITERNYIRRAKNSKAAFFDFWTKKEAVIKASGKGLSIQLQDFQVIGNSTSINAENFFLKEVYLNEKYKCHIAFKNRIDPDIIGPCMISDFNFSSCNT
ncbi:4'-phosphopantetheinyl transferase family protein [Flavobacterium branchiicola]|uniref:4'-phosphopantetheinyl transferase family protein n=1 Tax=Flavobacterium branchiicola TaxID=1114875 RepID=A0ABV9PJQ0_9FLAO|nr:4'-phosphopantetheinyl transferase superfamily protein [Flavobacterium branchiicola]MBS7256353.1 4'-phosphopantetheinyl transferase superfamily protein [Flavobacterium branchiicola]